MITIQEAKSRIHQYTSPLQIEVVPIEKSLGRALAENVTSDYDQPGFPQSAMDGYAVAFKEDDKTFQLKGESAAGKAKEVHLKPGQAYRIFTGAAVPIGADAVIMQEVVDVVDENKIQVNADLVAGLNIRNQGQQIKAGEVALLKGTTITAGTIGYLAALGIAEVRVFRLPRVALMVTGNELVKPGATPDFGEVFESNSYALVAALENTIGCVPTVQTLADDFQLTKSSIVKALEANDMVILTGGISVGDYDFVGKALNELGVEELFYKVMQKPGKPLYFGKYKNTYVFALPGNPAAALTCFYEYVFTCLKIMMGHSDTHLQVLKLPLLAETKVKGTRDVFLKGKLHPDGVEILDGQSSFVMKSFAEADCLVYLPAKPLYEKGELAEVHVL